MTLDFTRTKDDKTLENQPFPSNDMRFTMSLGCKRSQVQILSARLSVTRGRLANSSNGFLFSTTRVTLPNRRFKETASRIFRRAIGPSLNRARFGRRVGRTGRRRGRFARPRGRLPRPFVNGVSQAEVAIWMRGCVVSAAWVTRAEMSMELSTACRQTERSAQGTSAAEVPASDDVHRHAAEGAVLCDLCLGRGVQRGRAGVRSLARSPAIVLFAAGCDEDAGLCHAGDRPRRGDLCEAAGSLVAQRAVGACVRASSESAFRPISDRRRKLEH